MSQSHGFTDDRDRQSTLSVGDESNRTAHRERKTLEGSEAFADDRDHSRGETSTAEQSALVATAPDRDENQGTIGDVDEPDEGDFAFSGQYEADPSDPDVIVCPKCDSARHRDKWTNHGTTRTGYSVCPECGKPTPNSSLESNENQSDSFDFDDYGPTGRHPLPTAEATRDPDREALKARGVDVDGWDEHDFGGTGGFHVDDLDRNRDRDAERHAEVMASIEETGDGIETTTHYHGGSRKEIRTSIPTPEGELRIGVQTSDVWEDPCVRVFTTHTIPGEPNTTDRIGREKILDGKDGHESAETTDSDTDETMSETNTESDASTDTENAPELDGWNRLPENGPTVMYQNDPNTILVFTETAGDDYNAKAQIDRADSVETKRLASFVSRYEAEKAVAEFCEETDADYSPDDDEPSTDTDLTNPFELFENNTAYSVSYDDVPTPEGIPESDTERKIDLAGRLLRAGGNRTGFGHHEEIRRSMEGWAPGRDEDDPDDHRRTVFSMGPGERNFGDLSGEPEEQLDKAETVIEWARSAFPDGVFGEIVGEQIDAAREKWEKAHEEERKRQRARQFEEYPPAEVNGWERFESEKPDVEVAYRAINHGTPAVVAVYRDESGELDAHESTLSEWNDAETAAESKVNRHMVTVTRDEMGPYRDVLSHLHTFDGEPIEEADDNQEGTADDYPEKIDPSPYDFVENHGFFAYSGADGDLFRKNGLAGWRISLGYYGGRIDRKNSRGSWYRVVNCITEYDDMVDCLAVDGKESSAGRIYFDTAERAEFFAAVNELVQSDAEGEELADAVKEAAEEAREGFEADDGDAPESSDSAPEAVGEWENRKGEEEYPNVDWTDDYPTLRFVGEVDGAREIEVWAEYQKEGELAIDVSPKRGDRSEGHIRLKRNGRTSKFFDPETVRARAVEWMENHTPAEAWREITGTEPEIRADGGRDVDESAIVKHVSQSYSDTAKLRYLAHDHPGVPFETDEGLFTVWHAHDESDADNVGKVSHAAVRHYVPADGYLAELHRYRSDEHTTRSGYLTTAEESEVFEQARDAQQWLIGQGVEIPDDAVNIDDYRADEEPELVTDGGRDTVELPRETVEAISETIAWAGVEVMNGRSGLDLDEINEQSAAIEDALGADQEAATDGGQTTEPRTVDPENPPANATVRLIKGITRVLHSPKIVEGTTSSTGKTITVEEETSSDGDTRTYRLDSSEIFAGNTEFRKSTTFEIYTRERFRSSQRANHAPGSQTGSRGPTDADELPPATHRPPGEDEREQERQERKEKAQQKREERRKDDPKGVYPYGWDEIGRGAEIILDGQRGTFLVLEIPQDVAGTYRGLKLLGPDNDLYRLRSGNGEYRFLLEQGATESAVTFMSRVDTAGLNEGGTVSVQDYEVIGEDTDRLRRWIREEYHGE